MRSGLHRAITALTAVSACALALLVAAGPAAADTPPWEPDPTNETGTLTFYDTSGDVVTSGSTDSAPFAAYAVGSSTLAADQVQGGAFFANPAHTSIPALWYREMVGNYTADPLSSGPADVKALSATQPVVAGDPGDQTLDGFESDSVIDPTAGYQNMVQVRVRTANALGTASSTYDVADVLVDPATHTWTQVYPVPVALPAAPTAVTATAGNTSARVSWTAPSGAVTGYNVQLSSDNGTTWHDASSAFLTSTATAQTVTGLINGHTYIFRVAAINSAGTGPYSEPVSNAVTPEADLSAFSISGSSAVKYDTTATLTGKLTDAKTHGVLAGAGVALYRRANSSSSFSWVKSLTTNSSGSVSFGVKLTANAQFEWCYGGSSTHKSVTSAVRAVTATQVVSAARTASTIKHGGTVEIYGTVSPSGSGARIYLQQLVGGTWKTTSINTTIHKQTLPNHKTETGYLLKVKLSSKGTFSYRVDKPWTSTLGSGYSGTIVLKAT